MKVSPARQVVLAVLALVLLVLQARLWFGEGSLRHVASLERQVEVLNAKLSCDIQYEFGSFAVCFAVIDSVDCTAIFRTFGYTLEQTNKRSV